MIRNLKRNCSSSANYYFSNWFLLLNSKSRWLLFISWILLQSVMQNFFATMFDAFVNWVCRGRFIAAIVCCLWDIHYANSTESDQLIQLLFVSWSAFAELIFLIEQYEFFEIHIRFCSSHCNWRCRNINDTVVFWLIFY